MYYYDPNYRQTYFYDSTSNQFYHFGPAPRQVVPPCFQTLYQMGQQLHVLSQQAAGNNQLAEAACYEQGAVGVLRGLEPPPEVKLEYLRYFAGASHSLVRRWFAVGRKNEGVKASEETIQIYQRLAPLETEFDFVIRVSSGLFSLSSHLAEQLFLTEAVKPAQVQVEILRGYVPPSDKRVEYLDKFGEALLNLAIRLNNVGRTEEAKPPARDAVQVYRVLVGGNPVHYGPLLDKAEQLAGRSWITV